MAVQGVCCLGRFCSDELSASLQRPLSKPAQASKRRVSLAQSLCASTAFWQDSLTAQVSTPCISDRDALVACLPCPGSLGVHPSDTKVQAAGSGRSGCRQGASGFPGEQEALASAQELQTRLMPCRPA